jgi:hypothetical protein
MRDELGALNGVSDLMCLLSFLYSFSIRSGAKRWRLRTVANDKTPGTTFPSTQLVAEGNSWLLLHLISLFIFKDILDQGLIFLFPSFHSPCFGIFVARIPTLTSVALCRGSDTLPEMPC